MAQVYGKEMTRRELYMHVGNLTQIAGIKQYTYNTGRAKGVDAVEVNTGEFSFTLLPSRCLDIAAASYKGMSIGYLSKSGIRSPFLFQENGDKGYLDNFFGGLMCTSGLNNIGASGADRGKTYGMHGELTNIPADSTSVDTRWEGDECIFSVSAKMSHSRFYGEDVMFERSVRAKLGEARILIEDTIENLDSNSEAFMLLLYHINFGFPVVNEKTRLFTSPIIKTVPRTEKAAAGIGNFGTLCSPVKGYEEECFYHYFEPDKNGLAQAALYNPEVDLSVYLKYDMKALPYFCQWKMMREREYVFGFAPCNSTCEGRADCREKGLLPLLAPFEKRVFRLELGVKEGMPAF